MDFINEQIALNGLADEIVKGGVCLFNAVKYIYSIAEESFYTVDIKDAFKIVLNNITDTDSLTALGLRLDNDTCREMMSDEYNKVLPLIVYSLAVRVPVLKNLKGNSGAMTDDQLYKVYNAVLAKGAENYKDSVQESFMEIKYLVRKGKKLPPYNADWFKTYIYTNVPSLAEITNKNMFLLGFADVLFAMFYSCLEEALFEKIKEFSADDFGEAVEI
ncbi:MAG: hypothetical protein NC120_08185 [Ruminococcus sp.]|nr:hypothetical protein [Ruminococcus sp.]